MPEMILTCAGFVFFLPAPPISLLFSLSLRSFPPPPLSLLPSLPPPPPPPPLSPSQKLELQSARLSDEIVIHVDSGGAGRGGVVSPGVGTGRGGLASPGMGAGRGGLGSQRVGGAGKTEERKELHFSMFANARETFDLIEQLVKTAVTE